MCYFCHEKVLYHSAGLIETMKLTWNRWNRVVGLGFIAAAIKNACKVNPCLSAG